jgi:hypothetical protein
LLEQKKTDWKPMDFTFLDEEAGQETAHAILEKIIKACGLAKPARIEENAGVSAEARRPKLIAMRARGVVTGRCEAPPPCDRTRDDFRGGGAARREEGELGRAHVLGPFVYC